MKITNDFLDLFYPNICPGCKCKLPSSDYTLCLFCINSLPKTLNFVDRCNKLEMRMNGRFPFERIFSFLTYTFHGMVSNILHGLKYNNNKKVGYFLGTLFAEDIKNKDFIKDIDFIVPIPLHRDKYKIRGFNQSVIISQGICNVLNIPLSDDNVIRVINNPTQTNRTKDKRWGNVEGIFSVVSDEYYKSKHILLVDDVITTGSTIESCANMLISKNSNLKISVAVLGEVF